MKSTHEVLVPLGLLAMALALGGACGKPLVGAGGASGADGGSESECAPNEAVCGSGCAYLLDDEQNCGECGLVCAADEECAQGVCEFVCDNTLCGSECVLLTDSADHCGECGNACPSDFPDCIGGVCRPMCAPGLTRCTDACLDLSSDVDNCGDCRNACADGQTCVSGACE